MASEEERSSPIPKIEEHDSTESKENAGDELKKEEEKFKKRYPDLNRKGAVPSLLQKRLHKGMKYFDSGDYNMAKENARKKVPYPAAPQDKAMLQESTGETIPTPQNVPMRKTSINTQPIHPVKVRATLQS